MYVCEREVGCVRHQMCVYIHRVAYVICELLGGLPTSLTSASSVPTNSTLVSLIVVAGKIEIEIESGVDWGRMYRQSVGE